MVFNLNKKYSYAIIGASNNSEKYGHKIFLDLLTKGYDVIPINPNEDKILNKNCYSNISDVAKKIDVVVFVVPPIVTEKVLFQIKKLGVNKVWMQPGSESDKSIDFCKKNAIDFISNQCIMLS